LNDLFVASGILTDGFDALRRAYEQASPKYNLELEPPKPGEATEPLMVLCTDFPLEDDENSSVPIAKAVAQAVCWMRGQLESNPVGDWNRQPVAIPIAFERLLELREMLSAKQKLGHVDALHRWLQNVARDLENQESQHGSLQQLSSSFQQLRADALEIALHQKNKITFFAWDEPAYDFWNGSEKQVQDKEFFKTYHKQVRSVTSSFSQQRLVMVCGDLRRKLAWEDSLRN
jgi:hypothetical protein